MNNQGESAEVADLLDLSQTQASQNVVGNGNRKNKTAKPNIRVKRVHINRKRNVEGRLIETQNQDEVENVGTSDIASHNIEIIDVEQVKDKCVVDLTNESRSNESRSNAYVDLTSSPDVQQPRRQSVIRWQSVVPQPAKSNDKNTDEIVIVPNGSERVISVTSEPSTVDDTIMTCAICMDDFNQIKEAKRQLTSTTCGHVFCSPCIISSLRSQAKCPTCRKRVTKKQLHPIFL